MKSARTPQRRNGLDLEKPRQRLQQLGKSGSAPSVGFRRPTMFSATACYWSSCLHFQLLLIESPVLPTQTATFLLSDLPSAWTSSPLVKANPFLLLCPAAHAASLLGTAMEVPLLHSTTTGLVSLWTSLFLYHYNKIPRVILKSAK